MICVMDNGSTCDGLMERYCHGTSDGMALCPFFKTPAQAKQDNDRTAARLNKIGWVKRDPRGGSNTKPVRCIDTGEEFASGRDAAEWFHIAPQGIYQNIAGVKPHVAGHTFEYMEVQR